MKFLYLILTIVLIILMYSCDKETEISAKDVIIGTWISTDKTDTPHFVDHDSFYKSSVAMNYDHYCYELLRDSIKIGYCGRLYILVTPTNHYYNISRNKLTIDLSNQNCFGFEMKKIEYLRKE